MPTPKPLLQSDLKEVGSKQVSTWIWSEPKRFVAIGNGVTITADVSGDSITFSINFTRPDIVTGKNSEEVGIECEILYPDGTTTLYPVWQMDRLVKHTKHEIFMQGGLRDFPEEDLYLEIELPNDEIQVMDDNRILGFYAEDLTRAIRIHMKVIPQHIGGFVIKQQIAFSTGAVN